MDQQIIKIINDTLQNRFFDTEVEEHQVKCALEYPPVDITLTFLSIPTEDYRFKNIEAEVRPTVRMEIVFIDEVGTEWATLIQNGAGSWAYLPRGRYHIQVRRPAPRI